MDALFAGAAGVLFMRLPLIQIATLTMTQRAQLVRALPSGSCRTWAEPTLAPVIALFRLHPRYDGAICVGAPLGFR